MVSKAGIIESYQWWVSELVDMLPSSSALSLDNSSDMKIYIDRKLSRMEWMGDENALVIDEKFTSQRVYDEYLKHAENYKRQSVKSCDLYLAKNQFLVRSITLPLATEENIKEVVLYEVDKYTPFNKDDVYVDVKVVEKNKNENKLSAKLTVIKRDVISEVLKFCEKANIAINKIFALDNESANPAELYFISLPNEGLSGINKKSGYRYLLILCALLIVIAAILPIAKNYWIGSQYQSNIQAMSSEVLEVKELRSEFQALRKKADQAKQLNEKNILLIELLNELTKVIPDDTSLARLSVDENIIRIQGSSTSASKLIALLDSSEDFAEVDFVAPVTKNAETDKENFTIQIKLNLSNTNVSDK